jgi:T4 bacteriophage base plate protein
MNKLIDKSEDSRNARLEALFANSPIETEMMVDLPSKGKFYHDFNGAKVIPLLFEDEQRILASKNRQVNLVNEILSKCVKGVNLPDLLLMDKFYLLLKVREISYGANYNTEVACQHCGNSTKVDLDLSKHLTVESVPDDLQDPREFMLPNLKVKAAVKFPRVRDEIYFTDIETVLKNLYRFVVSIDGTDDPVFVSKALARMSIKDKKVIAKEINRAEYGVDKRFQFVCPHCSANDILEVQLDANFFSVS